MRTLLLIVGIALVIAGAYALQHGNVSYTKRERIVGVGSLKATAGNKEKISIHPAVAWCSVGAGLLMVIASGGKEGK